MNYLKIIYAGVAATAVMTGLMFLLPLMGLPKMDVGGLLGSPTHSVIAGWIGHIIIGILFVLPYAFFFNKWLPVDNKIARGAIYGIIVFVFSQIIMTLISMSGYLRWDDKESMAAMIFGSCIVHLVYGAIIGAFFDRQGYDGMEDTKRHA